MSAKPHNSKKGKTPKFLFFIYALIGIAVLTIGYNLWAQQQKFDRLETPELGQVLGNEDADKVIVEFLDYRCSYCRQLHPTLQKLLKERDDIKIVIRHHPLFGSPSIREAQIALAAARQDKFPEIHHALMQRNSPITDKGIALLAETHNLDLEKLLADMPRYEHGQYMIYNIDALERIGANSTPTLYINGLLYSGVPDYDTLVSFIDKAYGEDQK